MKDTTFRNRVGLPALMAKSLSDLANGAESLAKMAKDLRFAAHKAQAYGADHRRVSRLASKANRLEVRSGDYAEARDLKKGMLEQ